MSGNMYDKNKSTINSKNPNYSTLNIDTKPKNGIMLPHAPGAQQS